MQRKEAFTEAEIMNFLEQIIDPLEKLEGLGIAHRDIKPLNILLSHGEYRICDFEDAVRYSDD